MTNAEIAKKLLDFYGGDPSKWTQGAYGRDSAGNDCFHSLNSAVCYCLYGGLRALELDAAARGADWWDLFNYSVVKWNDAPGRTFADVEARLKEIAGV